MPNDNKALVFFYFDVTEESKRRTENMVRSLIMQLAYSKMKNQALNNIYDECQTGKRAVTQALLMPILIELLTSYRDVVMIIDAIDEAEDTSAALEVITQVHQRGFNHLHILLSSRGSPNIEAMMSKAPAYDIDLANQYVGSDICDYVRVRIDQEKRWDGEVREWLCKRVIERANGM